MDSAAIQTLRQSVTGAVVAPGDPDYPTLKKTFVHDGNPAVIVRAENNSDVAAAVGFAREHELVLSVRSGGHSASGFGTNEGGVVVDLTPINHVDLVDEENGLVRIGSGARWVDVGTTLNPKGWAISSGDTTTVGVGGLMLGGGVGWMVRKYGLAIDSLRGAEIVTADGQVVRASEVENPDLFWAIRGGGGNFGVVTSFEIAAQPVREVHFGLIGYPVADLNSVLKGWAEVMRQAPRELTTSIVRFPWFGGDQPPLFVLVCYAGDDTEAAEAAIAPLLEIGTVVMKDINKKPYPEILENPSDLPPDWEPRTQNRFLADCGDDFIDALTAQAEDQDTMFLEIRGIGGALCDPSPDATAFAHRHAVAMLNVAHLGSPDDTAKVSDRWDALWAAVEPWTQGAYHNFCSEQNEQNLAAAFPQATRARLAEIKRKYDPTNLFSRNPNIKPA